MDLSNKTLLLIQKANQSSNRGRLRKFRLETQNQNLRYKCTLLPFYLFQYQQGCRQQAMLHRRARMIIWPHGGQTANIVYSLPGVRVVEIMCGTPTSTGSINSIFYAKNLGIQWLTLHEPSCTHKGASEHPREFNLTIGDDVIKWLST